jgi:hypothetical protein
MEKEVEYDFIHIPKSLNNNFDKVYKKKKNIIKKIIKEKLKNDEYPIDFRS